MDKILLNGIRVFGHHGRSQEERETGQTLEVDIEIRQDLSLPAHTDQLEHTADYGDAFAIVQDVVGGGERHLLESIASDIARQVLDSTRAEEVLVRVTKPNPPLGGVCASSAVEIVRRHTDFSE